MGYQGKDLIATASNLSEMTEEEPNRESDSKARTVQGHEISTGASIGISIFDDAQHDGADLLRQADSVMYAAKRRGRNRAACFSEDLGLMAQERLTPECAPKSLRTHRKRTVRAP